jgi:transcriptional regulator
LTFDVSPDILYLERRWEIALHRPPLELLQGTLDLLILKALSWGSAHGYAIARWIEQVTRNVLLVGEGSLYPALHRLEDRGWVEAEWRLSEHNRRAKFYRLTARGRQQLRTETAVWTSFVQAVEQVLKASGQPA